jgi:hypothetical protein
MKTGVHVRSYLSLFFLEREMFRTKFAEEIKTHILCLITFFFFENRAVYEKMRNNIVEPDRHDNVAHALCMLNKQGYKHTLIMYNIIAFPLQQRLRERASVLWYSCIALLVSYFVRF